MIRNLFRFVSTLSQKESKSIHKPSDDCIYNSRPTVLDRSQNKPTGCSEATWLVFQIVRQQSDDEADPFLANHKFRELPHGALNC